MPALLRLFSAAIALSFLVACSPAAAPPPPTTLPGSRGASNRASGGRLAFDGCQTRRQPGARGRGFASRLAGARGIPRQPRPGRRQSRLRRPHRPRPRSRLAHRRPATSLSSPRHRLTDVFNAMATAFAQSNSGAHLTFNFASSGTLATQLGQGARADVFASADQTTMGNARNGGAIVGPDQVFARNSLIVITPKANPAHISSLEDLANPGIKVVTADTTVPIGNYTQTMLQKASADPAYGSDFADKFTANVVSKQTDDPPDRRPGAARRSGRRRGVRHGYHRPDQGPAELVPRA